MSAAHADFDALYGKQASDLDLNSQEFRFTAIRPEMPAAQRRLALNSVIEACEWYDEGNEDNLNSIPVLRGDVTFRKPHPDLPDTLHLRNGHRIRCEVLWFGAWKPLWEMRLQEPPKVNVLDGTATCPLADDLILASRSQGTFRYRRGKRSRKKGWRYHEIVANVCKRYRIPIGTMVKGTAWIKDFDPGDLVSPLEAIRQAVLEEQEHSGRRFLIAWRWSTAKSMFCLHIIHPVRNPMLYTLGPQLTGGLTEPQQGTDRGVATAVVATATTKKGKNGKRRKLMHREVAVQAVKQYGYVEQRVRMKGNVDSQDDVVRKAKRELAKRLKVRRRMTGVEHRGIAFVRRGDTVRLSVPNEGFLGDAGICFVVTVRHTVRGGDYTMSLDLTWTDPLDPAKLKAEREAALRAQKRAAAKKAAA